MSKTQADNPTDEPQETITTKIYVNMHFDQLASDINSNTLTHQFNGKGRRIALIPEEQEPTYLYYSSDKAGECKITPPFIINNGDNIKFKLQATPESTCTDFKWKDIIQNYNDLTLISGSKSTYKVKLTERPEKNDENDDIIININFKLDKVKFSASWDPRVRVRGD